VAGGSNVRAPSRRVSLVPLKLLAAVFVVAPPALKFLAAPFLVELKILAVIFLAEPWR
jgi:hypothetical protein